jgi:addiction module HigA family antidote
LAKHQHVSVPRVNDIVRERRAITADTAMRLARYLGTSAKLWMKLQAEYDLDLAASNRTANKNSRSAHIFRKYVEQNEEIS